jgi:hypothetical protein
MKGEEGHEDENGEKHVIGYRSVKPEWAEAMIG